MHYEPEFENITLKDSEYFYRLMQMYARELDDHQNRKTNPDALRSWTYRIVEKQNNEKRPIYLKFCCVRSTVIGFFYGDTDKPDDKGFAKPGYGCIMEFYVLPEYRRQGYGKKMFLYLLNMFRKDGIKKLYLTADPITGKPFWEALGFTATGEICPDNNQSVYEMKLSDDVNSKR